MKKITLILVLLLTCTACTQEPAVVEQKGELIYSLDSDKWHDQAKKQSPNSFLKDKDEVREVEIKPLQREVVEEQQQEIKPANKVNIVTNQKDLFSWPLSGKIVAEFGTKEDGIKHDGINIETAKGTDVTAARGGAVVYAGNELTGYGNLIIIKHDNGWLSAYGHLEKVELKKNAKVKDGQVIGHVGQTGNVKTPQLHFALRMAGKNPVDPLLYLPKRVSFDNQD